MNSGLFLYGLVYLYDLTVQPSGFLRSNAHEMGFQGFRQRSGAGLDTRQDVVHFPYQNDVSAAVLLGFLDTAYFCKQFKAHTGVTPMGFQKGLTNADGTADGVSDH